MYYSNEDDQVIVRNHDTVQGNASGEGIETLTVEHFAALIAKAAAEKPPLPQCVADGVLRLPLFLQISTEFFQGGAGNGLGICLVDLAYIAHLEALRMHYLTPSDAVDLKARGMQSIGVEQPVATRKLEITAQDLKDYVEQEFVDYVRFIWHKYWSNTSKAGDSNNYKSINAEGISSIVLGKNATKVSRMNGLSLGTNSCLVIESNGCVVAYSVADLTYTKAAISEKKGELVATLEGVYTYAFSGAGEKLSAEIKVTQVLKYGDRFNANLEGVYGLDGRLKTLTISGWSCEKGIEWHRRAFLSPRKESFEIKYTFNPDKGLLKRTSYFLAEKLNGNLEFPHEVGKGGLVNTIILGFKIYGNSFGFQLEPFLDHYAFVNAIFRDIVQPENK